MQDMTFNEDKIKRHSGGSAKGGQFAAKANSAPEASLTPAVSTPAPMRLNSEDIARTNENFRRSANKLMRNFQLDPTTADDLVQDSWVHLMERDRNKSDLEDRVKDPRFQTLVVKTLGKRLYGEGAEYGLRDTDYRARRMLAAREQAFQEANGRRMSGRERKEEAARVRMEEFAPQARPKPDFHVYKHHVSTDEQIGESGTTRGDLMEGSNRADAYEGGIDHSAVMNKHLDALDDGTTTKAELRDRVWDLISGARGVPTTKANALSKTQATRVRSVVKKAGGARALAERWLDGDATAEEEAYLFAPFDLSEQHRTALVERRDIASTLRGYQSGDKLWESTTYAATAEVGA